MLRGIAAVVPGLGIHLLGAGSRVSCAAILIAVLVGLLPTMFAHHTLRNSLRSAVQAALTVSIGQLAMHVSLTLPTLSPQVSPTNVQSARLLLAHGLVTTVVMAYLLGLQRTLQLIFEMYARLRTWLRVTFSVPCSGPVLTSLPHYAMRLAFARSARATSHGRRGPPRLA